MVAATPEEWDALPWAGSDQSLPEDGWRRDKQFTYRAKCAREVRRAKLIESIHDSLDAGDYATADRDLKRLLRL